MNSRAVKYRDTYLFPNSQAYELYHDKADVGHKKLDKHLKQVDQAHRMLLDRLPPCDQPLTSMKSPNS